MELFWKYTERYLLSKVIKQNEKIMGQLDDIKADLAALNASGDELKKDLDFIKAKLDASPGGLSSAATAEVAGLVKAARDKFAALDAETDSTEEA